MLLRSKLYGLLLEPTVGRVGPIKVLPRKERKMGGGQITTCPHISNCRFWLGFTLFFWLGFGEGLFRVQCHRLGLGYASCLDTCSE